MYIPNLFVVASFQTNQPTAAGPSRLWHVSTLESDTRHSLGKISSEAHECLKGPKDKRIHCAEAPSNDSLTAWIFHTFIKIMTCSTQGWNGPLSIVNPVQESEMGQKLPASLLYCLTPSTFVPLPGALNLEKPVLSLHLFSLLKINT